MRSDLDHLVGDLIRAGVKLRCPICGVVALWLGVPEYAEHRQACSTIQLGTIVGPEVEDKPKGWGWTPVDGS